MSNSKALVTLTLGPVYQFRWQRYCRANWLAYADRHGYDLICLDKPLDAGLAARSPAWQKCLILREPIAQQYERIVLVDSDLLFHPDAPCLASQVPTDKIGAVDEYATPNREQYRLALGRLYQAWDRLRSVYVNSLTPREFYTNFGLSPVFEQVVQPGVLVLSPAHHAELLASIYTQTYAIEPGDRGEMPALSHTLLRSGCVVWLDPRFNSLFAVYLALHAPELLIRPGDAAIRDWVGAALDEAYCLHLAGMGHFVAAGRARLDGIETARGASRAPSTAGRAAHHPAARVESPVVMFVFNRPDTTARVFEAVRQAQPRRLLLVADGPRPGYPADLERCAQARAVVEAVDWDCAVATDFAPINEGPKRRIETGLDWVFQQVEAAILLEDDCLPGSDFFAFCDELLARYRDDERVISISGNNFLPANLRGSGSYYLSRYTFVWGWATWRRAWQAHDPGMASWPAVRDSGWLENELGDTAAASYWSYQFQNTFETQHTWDYAWIFSSWRRRGLSIVPAANLVSNIGYGPAATHTQHPDAFAAMPVEHLAWPLQHPAAIERDMPADDFVETVRFSGQLRRLMTTVRARVRAGRSQ